MLNDQQLLRYSRHIFLPEIDVAGQEKIIASKILIVGAGGLGSSLAYYLAASGVGTIYISDFDIVELSNLQRQILHRTDSIGKLKTHSARDTLLALNPDIQVISVSGLPFTDEVPEDFLDALKKSDLVLDGCDNFATRYRVNALCVENQKSLISGSAIAWEGQVAIFPLALKNSPCYACLYPKIDSLDEQQAQCSATGVVSPLVGVIGSLQALEALKYILNPPESALGVLLLFDAREQQFHRGVIHWDDACGMHGNCI